MDEAQLAAGILAAMADGVIVSDAEGRIVYVSGRAERMTGYTGAELAGRSLESVVPVGLRRPTEAHRLRRRDGSELAVDIASDPLRADDETWVVTTVRDAAAGCQAERAEQLLVLEDRERIARELHDGAMQTLFGVGMNLQTTALRSGDAEVARRLEETVSTIDDVIRDLRSYIFGLRPCILREQGLEQALRRLVQDLERETELTTELMVDRGAAGAVGGRSQDVLHLASEALSNVRRHARARSCRIDLRLDDGRAVLEVEDDGLGFDPDRVAGAGQGMRNLAERSARLGGRLDVRSAPGQGTTLRVAIPL